MTARTGGIGGARQHNTAYSGGTVLAVQRGDLHVYQQPAPYLVERFPFRTPVDAGSWVHPSALLSAENRVVGFHGRRAELSELTSWRDDIRFGVSVRLMHGRAGQGKSRLAARLAEVSEDLGWAAARVRHARETSVNTGQSAALTLPTEHRGHLVIVDYAERWPLTDLVQLVLDRRFHEGTVVRFLLLARPSGGWWHSLRHSLEKAAGLFCTEMPLSPLARDQADRREIYREALGSFAQVLSVPEVQPAEPPGAVDIESRDLVLAIHMAALAHVLARSEGCSPPPDVKQLSAYLLARERYHWQAMYDNDRRIDTRPTVMARAVHIATLTRPVPFADGIDAIKRLAVSSSTEAAVQILDDHRLCYPPTDQGTVLEPLYPDRMAEDYIALQTPGHDIAGYSSDPWASTLIARLVVGSDDGRVAPYFPRALGILIEASHRWPHLAERELFPVLLEDPRLAFAAGDAGLSALVALPNISFALLQAIEHAVPTDPGSDLGPGVAALTDRLVRAILEGSVSPYDRAVLTDKLADRLWRAAHYAKAQPVAESAVQAWRAVATDAVDDRTARLARALNRLGTILNELRQWPEAEQRLGEAWRLWRRLSGSGPSPHDVDLVSCLEQLSVVLAESGRHDESIAVKQRAARLLRRLVGLGTVRADVLARSLSDMAERLRSRGLQQEALARVQEALPLWSDLVRRHPGRYEPGLAALLLVRGRIHFALRDPRQARRDVDEAVRHYRQFADASIHHDVEYAHALSVSTAVLDALHDHVSALAVLQERVVVHRRLAAVRPSYGTILARVLVRYGDACLKCHRELADGLAAAVEAVSMFRDFSAEQRNRFSADNTRAQHCIVDLLTEMGRTEEAQQVLQFIDRDVVVTLTPATPSADKASRRANELRFFQHVTDRDFSAAERVLKQMKFDDAVDALGKIGPFLLADMGHFGHIPSHMELALRHRDPMMFALWAEFTERKKPK